MTEATRLLRDRMPDAPELPGFKEWYDLGHEFDDPPMNCVNCGCPAIDLFEDASYGDIRPCKPREPAQ